MGYIDLHLHTTASDGVRSPSEIVNYAKSKGLQAIAITDHDTIEGLEEALAEGSGLVSRSFRELRSVPSIHRAPCISWVISLTSTTPC